jgi:hypothetical protein
MLTMIAAISKVGAWPTAIEKILNSIPQTPLLPFSAFN